jgi:hypothetical protein
MAVRASVRRDTSQASAKIPVASRIAAAVERLPARRFLVIP